jgi:hypothetical protein
MLNLWRIVIAILYFEPHLSTKWSEVSFYDDSVSLNHHCPQFLETTSPKALDGFSPNFTGLILRSSTKVLNGFSLMYK